MKSTVKLFPVPMAFFHGFQYLGVHWVSPTHRTSRLFALWLRCCAPWTGSCLHKRSAFFFGRENMNFWSVLNVIKRMSTIYLSEGPRVWLSPYGLSETILVVRAKFQNSVVENPLLPIKATMLEYSMWQLIFTGGVLGTPHLRTNPHGHGSGFHCQCSAELCYPTIPDHVVWIYDDLCGFFTNCLNQWLVQSLRFINVQSIGKHKSHGYSRLSLIRKEIAAGETLTPENISWNLAKEEDNFSAKHMGVAGGSW